jgi:hypothetical protein
MNKIIRSIGGAAGRITWSSFKKLGKYTDTSNPKHLDKLFMPEYGCFTN